jgi:hypothetical protein
MQNTAHRTTARPLNYISEPFSLRFSSGTRGIAEFRGTSLSVSPFAENSCLGFRV